MRSCLYSALLFLIVLLSACGPQEKRILPILGNFEVIDGDTVYSTVPAFSFVDQDHNTVTNATFKDKIYVADFFFIHCPTICPKVKVQCKRIYDKYADDPRVMLLSHSIDVQNDTVEALKNYAGKLGIQTGRWRLVTGNEDMIYEIADDYFSVAQKDPTSPGGFDHSGRLILVDTKRQVRSFCNGTDPEDVSRFMEDIDVLLEEEFPER